MSWVTSALVRTGVVDWLIAASPRRVRILMYHGVSPYCLQPELFAQQLQYLRSRFECYWASEIPTLLDGRIRTSRPPVVLTFDDGLRNNLTFAAPLLRDYDIKATFYVVSDLLDGRSMLWNHELLCRLLLTDTEHLPRGIGPLGKGRQARVLAARRFIETTKNWNVRRRENLLDTLRAQDLQPSYESWMTTKYSIMGLEELRSLPGNIEIGSHSRTHPILPSLGDDEARDEIHNSRRILEPLIGKPVVSFCYPDGQTSVRDEGLAAQAYTLAVSVEEGLVSRHANRHRLFRIPAAHNLPDFALRMVRPSSGEAAPFLVPESARRGATACR